jgi:hypothetical protein
LEIDSGGSEFVGRSGHTAAGSGIKSQTKERLLIGKEEQPNIEFVARQVRQPSRSDEPRREGFLKKVVYSEESDRPVSNYRPL